MEQNNSEPQSDCSLFVDIDILVDSVQVDQLRDVNRIKDIPANQRGENDTLQYKDIVENINGYGRLIYYKMFSNGIQFSSENCAILKV